MKTKLREPKVAALIMVVLLAASLFIGLNVGFYTLKNDITRMYQTRIEDSLEARIGAANGLIGLAKTNDVNEATVQRLQEDVDALQGTDSLSEQYDANSLLTGSFNGVAEQLSSSSAATSFQKDFETAQEDLELWGESYNYAVDDYNEAMDSFPAFVLRWAIFSGPLEKFH